MTNLSQFTVKLHLCSPSFKLIKPLLCTTYCKIAVEEQVLSFDQARERVVMPRATLDLLVSEIFLF